MSSVAVSAARRAARPLAVKLTARSAFTSSVARGTFPVSRSRSTWAQARHASSAVSQPAASAALSEDDLEDEEEVVSEEEELSPGDLSNFNMHPKLFNRLKKLGITKLFPVQVETFSSVRDKQDLIVRSRTGSGKTMAFALPVLDRLYSSETVARPYKPRAVVLLPTRELALQVHTEFQRLAPSLRCISVYGGASIQGQIDQLTKGADVVVGTPGRINDMLLRRKLSFENVESVILDEADEMLKMGFKTEIEEIFEEMPPKSERQTLMFSATVAPEIRSIANQFLNKSKMVDLVGDNAEKIPAGIELIAMPSVPQSRFAAIARVLDFYCTKDSKALVFMPTKAMTIELGQDQYIQETKIACCALNGDMPQTSREVALNAFRSGKAQCLVATDVAARGLDIPMVDLVVHFEIPKDFDSFIHRTGRTGRAGKTGRNVLLCDPKDTSRLANLERFCGKKFDMMPLPSAAKIRSQRTNEIIERVASVPEHTVRSFHDHGLRMVEDRLAQRNMTLGEEEKVEIANLIAATVSLHSGTNIPEFSVLTGTAGMKTLQTSVSLRKRSGPITSGEISHLTRKLDRTVAALLSQADQSLQDRVALSPNATGRRTGHIADVRVKENRQEMVFDVSSEVADAILSVDSVEFSHVTDTVPKFAPQQRDSDRNGFRGGNRGRDGRGGDAWSRDSAPSFRRQGGRGRDSDGPRRRRSSGGFDEEDSFDSRSVSRRFKDRF
mmetsp:Transcript_25890/g.73354  ORF Transcript_25890/g.73354 Transcript_25890/m.73354 type:complete len:725 (+) Transcript_25890:89-2263(+)